MIKDVIVNLSTEATTNFAVLVASTLQTHLAGVSFRHEPIVLPVTDMGGIPIDYIEAQRAANEQSAKNAKSKFDDSVGRAGLSSESGIIETEIAEAPGIFARIARRIRYVRRQPSGTQQDLAR